MNDQFFSNSQFGLWKKWFWMGIVATILSPIVGLVYGIALATEQDRKKEGLIIIVIAVIWLALVVFFAFFLGPWLVRSGTVPHYQLILVK
jgi:ABC-type spermidine/putrescine transport system permease subunit I